MSSSRFIAAASLVIGSAFAAVHAQEGHPLDGTWRGSIGPGSEAQTTVVIVMKWDGERIDGTVNPGRRATSFTAAALDVRDWTVRLETTALNAEGNAAPVVIEGTIEDLGSYHRTIVGTWTQDGAARPFTLRRE